MVENLLENKKILIVDDEPDILESLEELLNMCEISKATNFEDAKSLLTSQKFDIAILDIMGVDGYALLDIATDRKIVSVMLTAHALSPESIEKSCKGGAQYYIPKEEMADIETFLTDVLEAKAKGENPWKKWYTRLASFCEKKFGADWVKDEKDFWDKMTFH
jgi:DNA-binding NtrC family response regulator